MSSSFFTEQASGLRDERIRFRINRGIVVIVKCKYISIRLTGT